MADADRSILVVDDEPAQRKLLGGFVESLGFCAEYAATAEDALRRVQTRPPEMVLLDIRLPGMSGIEALAEIRKQTGHLPVLLITAFADVHQAVAAIKGGADDYLVKPIDLQELAAAIVDAIGQASQDSGPHAAFTQQLPDWFVCDSPAMRRVVETVSVVAPSEAPVLIRGESGTGKEMVAQLLHQWSPRHDGPLVTANCGGLPETLIESELFGHTKGAFTGATQSRQGYFRTADGGTLFLDEIGELPLHLQPKLLRALESGEIMPLGSDTPNSVSMRFVTATHRDLEQAVADGSFREDLYYRINVVELRVPRLCERREDIPALARRFAAEFSGGPVRLSPHSMQCLLAYSWSGNVRELRNAIQRACLLCRGDIILPEHLPPRIAEHRSLDGSLPDSNESRLSQVERATIMATLEETGGNRTHAAKKLGISRRALIYKLRAMEEEWT